jgi:hypothetical protein
VQSIGTQKQQLKCTFSQIYICNIICGLYPMKDNGLKGGVVYDSKLLSYLFLKKKLIQDFFFSCLAWHLGHKDISWSARLVILVGKTCGDYKDISLCTRLANLLGKL